MHVTVAGNLVTDPQLRFTTAGQPVAHVRVAHTERRQADGAWVDGTTTFLTCTTWRQQARHVTESLRKGDRVLVTGRLRQTDYQTGCVNLVWPRGDGLMWPQPGVGVEVSCATPVELATEVTAAGIAEAMSASTVRRILAADAIKPWQHRSWISVRDPNFTAKATRVLELYQRRWNGHTLGADEYVISSDEKTSIQARCRCHPTLPPERSRSMRVEHDYDRGGSGAYLAGYDVHRGTVIGRCAPTTGIKQFEALVERVMSQQPYASAKRVFWIVDNGSSHRGQAAIDRMAARWPNCVLVHTPVHASWLNQVEIFFSVVQRKVVSPNDFTDLTQVEQRLADFERRYNGLFTIEGVVGV